VLHVLLGAVQDAALHDRLQSDTYKRLNLGKGTVKAVAAPPLL
jgi:hypothetical protein